MVSYDLLNSICAALGCGVSDLLEYVPAEGEQINLFDMQEPTKTPAVYARARILVMKAAEHRPTYGGARSSSGGAA